MPTVRTVGFFLGLGLRLEPRRGNSKAQHRIRGVGPSSYFCPCYRCSRGFPPQQRRVLEHETAEWRWRLKETPRRQPADLPSA
jgi:hypothetical protein